jgi:hypothetical protein
MPSMARKVSKGKKIRKKKARKRAVKPTNEMPYNLWHGFN